VNATTLRVLLAIGGQGCTASDILVRLGTVPGDDNVPSLPALYRHLKVGLDEGWLEVERGENGTPGRPHQVYRITSTGAEAVAIESRKLQALAAFAIKELNSHGAT